MKKENLNQKNMKNNNTENTAYYNIELVSPAMAERLTRRYGNCTNQQLANAALAGNNEAGMYFCAVRYASIIHAKAHRFYGYAKCGLKEFTWDLFNGIWLELASNGWNSLACLEKEHNNYFTSIVHNTALKALGNYRIIGPKSYNKQCEQNGNGKPWVTYFSTEKLAELCNSDVLHNGTETIIANICTESQLPEKTLFNAIQQLTPCQNYVVTEKYFNHKSLKAIGHEMPANLRPAKLRGFSKELSEYQVGIILKAALESISNYIETHDEKFCPAA